jgi:hypothetical protein
LTLHSERGTEDEPIAIVDRQFSKAMAIPPGRRWLRVEVRRGKAMAAMSNPIYLP